MTIDLQKIEALLAHPLRFAGEGELRREESVFFLGKGLAGREALETIFDSDNESPVHLFIFSFAEAEDFLHSEELVRGIKKNFKGYVLGKFGSAPAASILDQAYAAGIDLLDLPLPPAGAEGGNERLHLLDHALTIFPRWSVLSSLPVGEEPLAATLEKIDSLLARGVVPLSTVTGGAVHLSPSDLARLFEHLKRSWRRARAVLKPVRPLLRLATPLATPPKKGIGGLLERLDDTRLRTASDLRRLLRVREVEQSFESAGL